MLSPPPPKKNLDHFIGWEKIMLVKHKTNQSNTPNQPTTQKLPSAETVNFFTSKRYNYCKQSLITKVILIINQKWCDKNINYENMQINYP